MAYPPITSLGTVPQRTQTPAEFATNGDSFLGALPNFRTELNTFGAYVDTKGAEVDADAAAAANSALESANSASDSDASAALALSYKDLAAGTANFKGSWSALTGALAVPASVYHNGLTWVLLSNLANVTAAEPGVSASWAVASGESYQRLVDNIFKRATLDLDFSANSHKVYEQFGLEPKQLQSVVVTSRNSTATYQSPAAIATAAINAPRITYDAATGNALGLLVEDQRTRLNTASASVTAPQNATVTAAAHTISFYGTGSVVLSGVHSATLVGTGSGRVTLTFTPTAGTLTMTPSGTVSDLQLELGLFASTIIRGNEGSQVTRLADQLSITLPSLSEGTIFVSANGVAAVSGKAFALFTLSDGTINNRVLIRRNNNLSGTQYVVVSAGSSVADVNGTQKTAGQKNNYAISWKLNQFIAAEDGSIKLNDSSGAVPSNLTQLGIGSAGSSASFGDSLNGAVERIVFIPRALTAAELQAITA